MRRLLAVLATTLVLTPLTVAHAASLGTAGALMTCAGEDDTPFDVDCQWQFTVVGRALPAL